MADRMLLRDYKEKQSYIQMTFLNGHFCRIVYDAIEKEEGHDLTTACLCGK